jgi:FkbM family methyltransferase
MPTIIERILAVKDQMLSDLEEIKNGNAQAADRITQAVMSKSDDARRDLVELTRAIDEQTGKMNWQLSSTATYLKEIREIIYEYSVPTQDPYSYSAETNAYRLEHPELAVLQQLRAFLPTRNVLDIGANVGNTSELLLSVGFRVYAFEPNADVYKELCHRFAGNTDFKALPHAVGAEDGHAPLHMVRLSADVAHRFEKDHSVYATLVKHALPDGVWFTNPTEVQVRTLKTLHQSREIPQDVAVVITDTEGGDGDVIQGMGKAAYSCIVSKFWDEKHYFSRGTHGLLPATTAEMRKRGYGWHLVIYRIFDGETSSDPRFYTNLDQSVQNSWGYVMYFKDFSLFAEALKWCTSNVRQNETFR